jgi:selenocysteine-specific translation elongation factor
MEWARSIGKETSSTSFGIGALKKDDKLITTVYPAKYPDKIWSLLFTLGLSDKVFLNIDRIDRSLGEVIIALDLLNIRNGCIHIDPSLDVSLVGAVIKDTVVDNYEDFDPEPAMFREVLMELEPRECSGPASLMIDQAFHVKGVGCVALGFVSDGSIRKHQELITMPGGKKTIIRSIQIHDKDQMDAPAGARVGLALKNIDPEDLPRGCILVPPETEIDALETLKGRFNVAKLWKDEIEEGSRFHLWNSLQFIPVQLRNVNILENEGTRILECDLDLENRAWSRKGNKLGLAFLDSNSFRLFAAGESI